MDTAPMKVVESNPGVSSIIPLDTSNRANHNGDDDSNTSKNPVGNDKDCD